MGETFSCTWFCNFLNLILQFPQYRDLPCQAICVPHNISGLFPPGNDGLEIWCIGLVCICRWPHPPCLQISSGLLALDYYLADLERKGTSWAEAKSIKTATLLDTVSNACCIQDTLHFRNAKGHEKDNYCAESALHVSAAQSHDNSCWSKQ